MDFIIGIFTAILVLFVIYLIIYIYFLPYNTAKSNNHPNTDLIFILNIFAGYTIIGWLLLLIWAHKVGTVTSSVNAPQRSEFELNTAPSDIKRVRIENLSVADELQKLHELKEKGVITQNEFSTAKERLIG